MSDEFIVSDFPCILWKFTGVSGPFKFKSKPFQLYGIEMKLKIIYSYTPLIGYSSLILLKNQENSINVLFTVNVNLGPNSDHSAYASQSIDFSSNTEHIVWLKKDSDLTCNKYVQKSEKKSFCDLLKDASYYFRIVIYPCAWKPQKIPACQAIGEDFVNSSVGQDLSTLFNNPHLSDVTIECDDGKLHAHRAILAARSKFFDDMFRDGPRDQPKNLSLSFKDVAPSVLRRVLRYLYSGDVPDIDSENIRKVYAAADKFQLDDLKLKCVQFMQQNTSIPDTNHPKSSVCAATEKTEQEFHEKAIVNYVKNITNLFRF